VSIPTNVETVQLESNAIINFQPISKELVNELLFGPPEPEFPESVQIAAEKVDRLLQDAEDAGDVTVEDSPFLIDNPEDVKSPLASTFALSEESLMKALRLLGIILAVSVVMIVVIVVCLRLCTRRCERLKGLCHRLKNMLMWNSLLRYYMMTFISTAVGCAMQLYRTTETPTLMEKVQSILALLVLLGMVVLSLVLTRFLIKNRANLKDVAFMQRFGTIYTPCETGKGSWPLLFFAIFCLRR